VIAGLLLFLQVNAAPPPNLVVRQGEVIKTVPVIPTVSGSYVRADLLATALGGSAGDVQGGRYRVTLGDSRFEFEEGVPFIRTASEVVPTILPPLRSGRTFLLPYQFATSIIPKSATGFNFDVAANELRIFSTAAR
jgi:hypothetical protein